MEELVQLISQRVGRCLERQGLLEQDTESAWLDLDPAEDTDPMPQILGSSVSYRIAVGPQQGRKAFMIRTIRPLERPDPGLERKTPYREGLPHERSECFGYGTTQVAFEPADFIARLAALVPKPRVNLTRYHGVLAPNHRWRGLVTPARRGKGIKSTSNAEVRTPAERHTARACPALSGMTWAQRLKRVFNIDMPQGTLS